MTIFVLFSLFSNDTFAQSEEGRPACIDEYDKSVHALRARSQQLFELLVCIVRQGESSCEEFKKSAFQVGHTDWDMIEIRNMIAAYRECQYHGDNQGGEGLYQQN